MEYCDINAAYISMRFPKLKKRIDALKQIWQSSELSPYTLFYDVIFQDICELFAQNATIEIKEYFEFVEDLLSSRVGTVRSLRTGDDVENLIQTGFLEYFWDTPQLYILAQQNMGVLTRKIFENIGTYLNQPNMN